MDILTMCEYETVAVENGRMAMEELNNENNNFDLVLLDIYMPEMDGFEVLTVMKDNPRLKDIPVVVMSADEKKDVIATSLQLGAVNYIIKPVRVPQCRALTAFMTQKKEKVADKEKKGLNAQFELVRFLGNGSAGRVDLMKGRQSGELVAVKQIQLQYLSDDDKRKAEQEIEFLKVITGPTIIMFQDSFIDKQIIYIVMEYAEGGNLAQLIKSHAQQGKRFTDDEVLMYVA